MIIGNKPKDGTIYTDRWNYWIRYGKLWGYNYGEMEVEIVFLKFKRKPEYFEHIQRSDYKGFIFRFKFFHILTRLKLLLEKLGY